MGLGGGYVCGLLFPVVRWKVDGGQAFEPFPAAPDSWKLLPGAGHAKGKLARVEDVQRDIVCCASVFGTRM